MTREEEKRSLITYWLEKAVEAIASAQSELAASRFSFAMNRSYYACFYSASAFLLQCGSRFSKHSGVRSAVHQHLVKPGLLLPEYGKIYDRLFENRQESDYLEFKQFEQEQVEKAITDAHSFVKEIQKRLI